MVPKYYKAKYDSDSAKKRTNSNRDIAMPEFFFKPQDIPALPVLNSDRHYAVNRIFCVGRNYADHAREMGAEVDRQQPFFFTKPANAIVHSGTSIDYAPGTASLHYEMELVIALASPLFEATREQARQAIFGMACGIDLTRRDLQTGFKQKGLPWDLAKAFEDSAVISAISRNIDLDDFDEKVIELSQNGEIRQRARLGDMVWRLDELLEFLSRYYHLQAGDIIFTGTPAGVGAVQKGDHLSGSITDVGTIEIDINK